MSISPAETDERRIEVDLWLQPGAAVARAHVHEHLIERFEVVAGEVGFQIGGRQSVARRGDGTVEVAYSVDPAFRLRGYAKAILRALLRRADDDSAVRAVRASIRPDNAGSLATIAGFGFRKVGE